MNRHPAHSRDRTVLYHLIGQMWEMIPLRSVKVVADKGPVFVKLSCHLTEMEVVSVDLRPVDAEKGA
jgi:hypothetical protein